MISLRVLKASGLEIFSSGTIESPRIFLPLNLLIHFFSPADQGWPPPNCLEKRGLPKKSWLLGGEFGIRALRRVKIEVSTANSD